MIEISSLFLAKESISFSLLWKWQCPYPWGQAERFRTLETRLLQLQPEQSSLLLTLHLPPYLLSWLLWGRSTRIWPQEHGHAPLHSRHHCHSQRKIQKHHCKCLHLNLVVRLALYNLFLQVLLALLILRLSQEIIPLFCLFYNHIVYLPQYSPSWLVFSFV